MRRQREVDCYIVDVTTLGLDHIYDETFIEPDNLLLGVLLDHFYDDPEFICDMCTDPPEDEDCLDDTFSLVTAWVHSKRRELVELFDFLLRDLDRKVYEVQLKGNLACLKMSVLAQGGTIGKVSYRN